MMPSVVEARPQWDTAKGFAWYVVVLIRSPHAPWGLPNGFRTPWTNTAVR